MTRNEAISALKAHQETLKSLGATSLSLFQSRVRDEAGDASDLDVFVDYDPETRFNAFDLVWIKLFLEGALRIEIDVATRDSLHLCLRPQIERTAVRLF